MTMKHALISAVLLLAALASSPAPGEELVREFRGDHPMQTDEFEVEAPWILDWRVTGEFVEQLAVDVSLERAGLGTHEGSVVKARDPGNGVRLFDQGGRFYFRVNSTFANWTLRVYQLTREEAKLYTPKNPSKLDY